VEWGRVELVMGGKVVRGLRLGMVGREKGEVGIDVEWIEEERGGNGEIWSGRGLKSIGREWECLVLE